MEVVCDNSFCELNITILDKSSELYLKCLEEVQVISSATLFAPVVGCEAVQSMGLSFLEFIQFPMINILPLLVLVSGWSDNGWLSGGHAVRMAMELCPSSFCLCCCSLSNSKFDLQQWTRRGQDF
jgi:hypothetical protein